MIEVGESILVGQQLGGARNVTCNYGCGHTQTGYLIRSLTITEVFATPHPEHPKYDTVAYRATDEQDQKWVGVELEDGWPARWQQQGDDPDDIMGGEAWWQRPDAVNMLWIEVSDEQEWFAMTGQAKKGGK